MRHILRHFWNHANVQAMWLQSLLAEEHSPDPEIANLQAGLPEHRMRMVPFPTVVMMCLGVPRS